jgi:hypothetical protein
MTNLAINAVKLTQMCVITQVHSPFLRTVLQAYWQTGYASNPSDPTTFQAVGASGFSGYNTGATIAALYTGLIGQIQTDTGLTFVQNGGTITLFDAFTPILPSPPAVATAGTTTAVTGSQLACPFLFYTDGAGNYFTLARHTLMSGSTPISPVIQTATTPAAGDAPADVYNNIVAAIGSQVSQTFSGSGALDVFTDPYSS